MIIEYFYYSLLYIVILMKNINYKVNKFQTNNNNNNTDLIPFNTCCNI